MWIMGLFEYLTNDLELCSENEHLVGCRWFIPVILATQEAEIRRIAIQTQPWQIVRETLSQISPSQNRAGRVTQGIEYEFKSQHRKIH
jgi:hypothetical protein